MSDHPFGQFDSWEIITEAVARKTCDISFFKYRGSGVPLGIRWFFDVEELAAGDKRDLILVYEGVEYKGQIQRDSSSSERTRIFWDTSLAEEFDSFAQDGQQYILEFHRESENRYSVRFVERATESGPSTGIPTGIHMREIIEKFMRGYPVAKTEVFANNPFGDFVRKEIPMAIYNTRLIEKE